jgi:hypothetical protein
VGSLKGNIYTLEEKKYFSKYISWALQVDPLLTKSELIEKLAKNVREPIMKPESGFNLRFSQVPRHTASSWNAHWARDPLADRLLVAARERATRGQGSTGNVEKDVENDRLTAEEESSYEPDKDETATSERGRFFTATEMRTMAKHIARYDPDEWAMMTSKQRWNHFHHDVTHLDDHT